MYYQEYHKAATRHLSVCKQLLIDIDTNPRSCSCKHWMSEVYYLSGYIMECMLSYILYYQVKTPVEDTDIYKNKDTRCKFMSHSLKSKAEYIIEYKKIQHLDIPFISTSSTSCGLNKMFNEWGVEWRYLPNQNVNLDILKAFVSDLEIAKNRIINIFPLL